MNIWESLTGSDISREWEAFEVRATALPPDHRAAWEQIKAHLLPYADFTARNLTPIMDNALGLLEQTAADGLSIDEALGGDIEGFCAALAGGEAAAGYRARWRAQLNRNVAKRLGRRGH